jgi:hypothetical protein
MSLRVGARPRGRRAVACITCKPSLRHARHPKDTPQSSSVRSGLSAAAEYDCHACGWRADLYRKPVQIGCGKPLKMLRLGVGTVQRIKNEGATARPAILAIWASRARRTPCRRDSSRPDFVRRQRRQLLGRVLIKSVRSDGHVPITPLSGVVLLCLRGRVRLGVCRRSLETSAVLLVTEKGQARYRRAASICSARRGFKVARSGTEKGFRLTGSAAC